MIGFKRGPGADVFQSEFEPELAASWERSPDGLTFTFNIAAGRDVAEHRAAEWARKFTAEDAQLRPATVTQTEGVHKSYYANVTPGGFEAVDDATLKINMAKATADFLNPLGSNKQTIFPK